MSRMHAPERAGEVPAYASFFEAEGYAVETLDADLPGTFEGMGDALWHPAGACSGAATASARTAACTTASPEPSASPCSRSRCTTPTSTTSTRASARSTSAPHSSSRGPSPKPTWATIRAHFERVLEAPEDEARTLFACNAHSPDGETVLVQRGCTVTNGRLEAAGYRVVEVETDEYLKSGGSVFCMKLMFW